MTAAEFQRLLDPKAFEPFTVTLTGGSTCDVLRPEWAKVTPSGSAAEISRSDGRKSLIALGHVVSITYPDTPVIR